MADGPQSSSRTGPSSDNLSNLSGFLVFGQPSRHIACDRCRSQKVKCLPTNDDTSAACQRCQRAGAHCTQSSLGRIGRPPNYNKREQKIAQRRLMSGRSSASLGLSIPPTDSGGLMASAIGAEDESQRNMDGMSFPTAYEDDVDSSGESPDELYSCSGTTALDRQLSAASEKQNPFPFDFLSDTTALHDNIFSFDSIESVEEVNSMALNDPSAVHSQFTFLEGLDNPHSADQDVNTATVPPIQAPKIDQGHVETLVYIKTSRRDLLSLNTTLHSLMDETARVTDENRLLQTEDNQIDKILRATQTFLDVVGSFVPNDCEILKAGRHTVRLVASSPPNVHQDERRFQNLRALDIHDFLIVVSCYTLIMRVYGNLVSYVRERVQCDDAEQTCTGLTLPALQVGMTTIQNDTSLQAVLLLRIWMSKIQRINSLMGSILSYAEHQDTKEAVPSLSGNGNSEPSLESRSTSPKTLRAGRTSFGSRGQRVQVDHLKNILDAAIKQEDCESGLKGQGGIGSLERAIEALEKLL